MYSTFDTGSSGVLFSSDYFDHIIIKLFTYLDTQNFIVKEGVVFSECFEPYQLPSLYVMFNRLWIELKGVDYMVDVSGDGSLC